MTVPDARTAALADLQRAIQSLAAQLEAADDLAQLAILREAAARLAPHARQTTAGLRDFDPARFQRLLELTGPSMAGALLAHLQDDLTKCRKATATGADLPDWAALREGSHVLISLAGSVGAASLQALAETLNAAANGQDHPAVKALMPTLLEELDALILLVRQTQPPAGASR